MKKILLILIIILTSAIEGSQPTSSIGAGFGIGSLFGNFPSQTTFGGKIFFETPSPITIVNNIQIHFTYGQKIEKFIPGSFNYDHYSYYMSLGASGIFNQSLGNNYFIEEGIGIIYANDRSFDDIDVWNYGFLINFTFGYTLNKNINLTANVDSGLTLDNTNISFIIFHIGTSYIF